MMKDDLSNLLKEWDIVLPEPAAFKRNVWRRIESDGDGVSSAPERGWKELVIFLARPQIAAAVLTAALLLGAWIGHSTADQDGREAYLRSINPYAKATADSLQQSQVPDL
jgi:hypothetical protein